MQAPMLGKILSSVGAAAVLTAIAGVVVTSSAASKREADRVAIAHKMPDSVRADAEVQDAVLTLANEVKKPRLEYLRRATRRLDALITMHKLVNKAKPRNVEPGVVVEAHRQIEAVKRELGKYLSRSNVAMKSDGVTPANTDLAAAVEALKRAMTQYHSLIANVVLKKTKAAVAATV
jgi:hypothetical protein